MPSAQPPNSQMDLLFVAERRAAWRVGELVAEICGRMEKEYPDVRVVGEISNFRRAASGHIYFTLKDGRSQLPVVLFKGKTRALRFSLADGLEVQVRGRVSVYEDRGQLQLVAETVEPRGKGSLQIAFEQLYAALKAEGLFDLERKRPLPAYPRIVGVITSATGAVIHDILNVLGRRHASVQVLLYPVSVQGDAATGQIVEAFEWFRQNPCVDILLLARGGGSLEDLAAFNSEPVARAIAISSIPVVAAVGHETDFTISDFVADLRAPTPSAAAELITDAQYRVEEHLQMLASRLERATRYQRMQAWERLGRLNAAAVFARMQNGLGRRQQRMDELRFRLESLWDRSCGAIAQRLRLSETRLMQQDVRRQLALHCERLRTLETALAQAVNLPIAHLRARATNANGRLIALSPLAVLERGYALVYDNGNALVKDSSLLHRGDRLRMRFFHGQAQAAVVETGEDTKESE